MGDLLQQVSVGQQVAGRLPAAVDLRVLGRCNLRCPFCFGPRHEVGAGLTAKFVRFLERAWGDGARAVVVTGGEPLLHRGVGEIIRSAKELGYRVTLSTNGTLLARRGDEVLPWLDWVALPLESLDRSVHDRLRPGPSSYQAVLDSFGLVRRDYPRVQIKLGTVLQPGIRATVADIPARWPLASAPDVWKVYEVSLSNYALDNAVSLHLSSAAVDAAMARCERAAVDAGWRFTAYRNSTRDGQYVFVEPDGTAMVIDNGDEQPIGNFFTNYDAAVSAVGPFVDHDRVERNYAATYH